MGLATALDTSRPECGSMTTKSVESGAHVHGMIGVKPLAALSHGGIPVGGIPRFPSFSETRQWQLEHMAAAFRHWARQGFVMGASGHISVRDPEYKNAFWTNPLGRFFGSLKASDMILLDLDGNVIGGNKSLPANAAGFLIHSAIHRQREDAHAICHAHTTYGKAWSAFGKPFEMLSQDSCKFHNKIRVYDSYGGVVLAKEEGDAIAKALGDGSTAILRNHGLLTVGTTVDEAAFLFLAAEQACQAQLLVEAASVGGLKKKVISEEEAAYVYNMENDPEYLYLEFQSYYEQEDEACQGAFKS